MDQFIGEIRAFPYSFAPRDWALCNGQLMQIADYTALYSIIGITYGGNGRTTFALPNLMGQVSPGFGHGLGLSLWQLGQSKGENQVTLLTTEMPAHNHSLIALNTNGTANAPDANAFLANDVRGGGGIVNYMNNSQGLAPDTEMSSQAISPAGDSQAHENRQPYLTLNFCIALDGNYPSRN